MTSDKSITTATGVNVFGQRPPKSKRIESELPTANFASCPQFTPNHPEADYCACGPTPIKVGDLAKLSNDFTGQVVNLADNVLYDGLFVDHQVTIRGEAKGKMRTASEPCDKITIVET